MKEPTSSFGSIPELKREVDQRGWLTPKRVSRRNNEVGGRRFSRGHLRLILENPVYRGQIVHKGTIYQGQHPPIIDEELWLAVQTMLAKTLKAFQTREGAVAPCLLSGLLFDHEGRKFASGGGHVSHKKTHYRFYICSLSAATAEGKPPENLRLPANDIEGVVIDALVSLLTDKIRMAELISSADEEVVQQQLKRASVLVKQLSEGRAPEKIEALQSLLDRVSVHRDYVEIAVKSFLQKSSAKADAINRSPATVIKVPVKLRQRSKAIRLVVQPKTNDSTQDADPKLGALISKAHDWLSRLTSGRYDGVQAIATEEKMTSSYVTRVIYVAYLAPDISLRVLQGDHPSDLTAKKLLSLVPLPDRWEEQRQLLGMQN